MASALVMMTRRLLRGQPRRANPSEAGQKDVASAAQGVEQRRVLTGRARSVCLRRWAHHTRHPGARHLLRSFNVENSVKSRRQPETNANTPVPSLSAHTTFPRRFRHKRQSAGIRDTRSSARARARQPGRRSSHSGRERKLHTPSTTDSALASASHCASTPKQIARKSGSRAVPLQPPPRRPETSSARPPPSPETTTSKDHT